MLDRCIISIVAKLKIQEDIHPINSRKEKKKKKEATMALRGFIDNAKIMDHPSLNRSK